MAASSGRRHGLLGFGGAGALMPAPINGADGIAVGVAGLDLVVMEGRGDERLRGRDALPNSICPAGLAAIDLVAGKVGFGDGLPAEVDSRLGSVFAGGGYGGHAGGHGGGEDVHGLAPPRGGEVAGPPR